jgi:hypothetical protein
MKIFQKDNKIKSLNKIILYKDDMQILNPTEEMVLADGWVEYKEVLTDEQIFNRALNDKLIEIEHYDKSNDVNIFYINSIPVWLDKETRTGLKLRFEAEMAMDNTDTTLWYNNMQIPLSLNDAMQMLYAIEVYASKCYDNTQRHISIVNSLNNIDDIKNYNYQDGYPEQLIF